MPENISLENLSREGFRILTADSIARSADGKMMVIKHDLFWEVLCVACSKSDNPHGRYLCVTYNENYLGKIFGPAVNSYTNYVTGGETIAKHFHNNFKELFRVESLTSSLLVTLKNPENGKMAEFALSGKLIDFEGKNWLREIIIPAGIAHKLHNPSGEITAVAVTTSGQHNNDDVFPYEM